MAGKLNLDVEHMNAVTTFLQGDPHEEAYMQQSAGMENGTAHICRLKRSLYVLKQEANRIWKEKMGGGSMLFYLQCSQVDTCVYYRINKDNAFIVAVYADDVLIITNNQETKKQNHRSHRTRLTGWTIKINQQKYIREVLDRFNMSNYKPVKTRQLTQMKRWSEFCGTSIYNRHVWASRTTWAGERRIGDLSLAWNSKNQPTVALWTNEAKIPKQAQTSVKKKSFK